MDVVRVSQKKNWIQLQDSVLEVSENSRENDLRQLDFWEDWHIGHCSTRSSVGVGDKGTNLCFWSCSVEN